MLHRNPSIETITPPCDVCVGSCPVLQAVDGASLSRLYHKLELPACALATLLLSAGSSDAKVG